jgi:hypothetical protein
MDRRDFLLTSLAGALAVPLAAEAQQAAKVSRVGYLAWDTCPGRDSVFGMALRDLGYTWGQTIQVI